MNINTPKEEARDIFTRSFRHSSNELSQEDRKLLAIEINAGLIQDFIDADCLANAEYWKQVVIELRKLS